jgi:hypothetical protein
MVQVSGTPRGDAMHFEVWWKVSRAPFSENSPPHRLGCLVGWPQRDCSGSPKWCVLSTFRRWRRWLVAGLLVAWRWLVVPMGVGAHGTNTVAVPSRHASAQPGVPGPARVGAGGKAAWLESTTVPNSLGGTQGSGRIPSEIRRDIQKLRCARGSPRWQFGIGKEVAMR